MHWTEDLYKPADPDGERRGNRLAPSVCRADRKVMNLRQAERVTPLDLIEDRTVYVSVP